MRLTEKLTAGLKLPAGKDDFIAWDDEVLGFGARVREGGSKTLIFQYKLGAKQRRMKLGRVGAVDFDEARKRARKYSGQVADGKDPAGELADTKAKAHKTFKAVAQEFLDYKRDTLRPRSYPDVERHLLVHAKTLHGLQIDKIKLADISAVIGAVEKNAAARKRQGNGAVTRNRARTSLSTFFSWALSEGYVTANPVNGTKRAKEKSRDRVLTPAELCLIWQALPADHFGAIMKLLAITGQREGEIAGLRWSEVHGDLIKLPAERTKNGRPHIVPLSSSAKSIIEAQPRRMMLNGEPRDLIFGTGEGPFSGWSKAKAELDAKIKKAAGKAILHWTPHDLRRTAATMMAKIGVAPHIIEAALNHVSGHKSGVAGIYNRDDYSEQVEAALSRWAEGLDTILAGKLDLDAKGRLIEIHKSNVTSLRRPA